MCIEKPSGTRLGNVRSFDTILDRRVFKPARSGATSRTPIRRALARSGKLGRLHTVHASIYKQSATTTLPPRTEPPRDIIDWDQWLGPERRGGRSTMAYVVERRWRGYTNSTSGPSFSTGAHTRSTSASGRTTPTNHARRYAPDGGHDLRALRQRREARMRPGGWSASGAGGRRSDFAVARPHLPGALDGARLGRDRDNVRSNGTPSLRASGARSHASTETCAAHPNFALRETRGEPAAHENVMRHTHTLPRRRDRVAASAARFASIPQVEYIVDESQPDARRAMRLPWHCDPPRKFSLPRPSGSVAACRFDGLVRRRQSAKDRRAHRRRAIEHDLFARARACQQLTVVRTQRPPVLASLLADEKHSHYAREAQERALPAAGEALRAAMRRLEGDLLIGVVNPLACALRTGGCPRCANSPPIRRRSRPQLPRLVAWARLKRRFPARGSRPPRPSIRAAAARPAVIAEAMRAEGHRRGRDLLLISAQCPHPRTLA